MVTKKRHIAKALTWRLIGSILTSITIYFVSGDINISLGAGIADSIIKIFAYYCHERLWYQTKWGVDNDKQ